MATKARDAQNHQQAGDPVAFGRAIVELAHLEHPPTELPAGSDAVQVLNDKATSMQETTAEWRTLAVSTDLAALAA